MGAQLGLTIWATLGRCWPPPWYFERANMLRRLALGGVVMAWCATAALAQPGGQPKGPGGGFPGGGFQPFAPPQPGEILPKFMQDVLKLNADQKKRLAELQKDVNTKLAKILTADQKKTMENMRPGAGKGFGPGPGFGPPPGGGPTPPGGTPGGALPKMGFGGPGGFGGFGAKIDIQKKIGATDEEWKVINPKLQKVAAARRTLLGENTPFGGQSGSGVVARAQADLKAVLDEKDHTKEQVAEKIAAVRKARETARAEYAEAQRDLERLLTPSQQAILVSLGQIE